MEIQSKQFEDFENAIKREFGDKYKLAIWFADYSIAKYDGPRGDVIIFSRLQTCSHEKGGYNPPWRREELQVCLIFKTKLECLFEQEPPRNALRNILSQISVNNDDISWDASKFEGD